MDIPEDPLVKVLSPYFLNERPIRLINAVTDVRAFMNENEEQTVRDLREALQIVHDLHESTKEELDNLRLVLIRAKIKNRRTLPVITRRD